jgi:hypothetical protein
VKNQPLLKLRPVPRTLPGPEPGPGIDAVETALADALQRASVSGAWSTVERLAAELEARREERSRTTGAADVVILDSARRKGGATRVTP